MSTMVTIHHLLIEFKPTPQKKTDVWYCKSLQELMAGKLIGLGEWTYNYYSAK